MSCFAYQAKGIVGGIFALALSGCTALMPAQSPDLAGDELLWSSTGDEQRPRWVGFEKVVVQEDFLQVRGESDRHDSMEQARRSAVNDGLSSAAQYIAVELEEAVTEGHELGGDDKTGIVEGILSEAWENAGVSEQHFEQWYMENSETQFYVGFLLMTFEKSFIEDQIELALEEHSQE